MQKVLGEIMDTGIWISGGKIETSVLLLINAIEAGKKKVAELESGLKKDEYLQNLEKEYALTVMTTEELRRQELIRLGITGEEQDRVVALQERLDLLEGGDTVGRGLSERKTKALNTALDANENSGPLENFISEWKAVFSVEGSGFIDGFLETVGDLKEALLPFNEATREYAAASFRQAMYNMAQGTDIGTFVSNLDKGVEVALIETFVQALANAVGGMEGLTEILNPITGLLRSFSPVIKSVLLPLLLVSRGLSALADGVMSLLNIITFGLFDEMSETYDLLTRSNDERERESEQLRRLTEQMEKLRDSIRENEEYYLKKRRELNAGAGIESLGINDMILTPHGNFSTSPDDYIIATKDPRSLGSGGTVVNISVRNEAGDVAAASVTKTEGISSTDIAVTVRKIVSADIAGGKLDGAFDAMRNRRSGRKVGG
jgi:hypothetical protein